MTITAAPPSILPLLTDVARAGVSIALAGDGRLVVQAPPMGTVPSGIRVLLTEHRTAIVADLERRRTLGDRPALRSWLCVSCQERYPSTRPDSLCAVCGAAADTRETSV